MTFSIGNGLYSGLSSIFSGGVGNDEDNNEADVKTARDNLNKAGYEVGDKSSGILDRELDTATKSFQRDNGLKIDGIIRPNGETEQALNTIVKRKTGQSKEVKGKDNNFFPEMPKPLKLQSSIGDGRENKSEDINSVENALAGLGHLKIGEFNKDKGTIRPSLVKAIKAFQKDNGLFVDGVMKPDGETQEALSKETKSYFNITPTKEEQERQERARKQREKPLIEQIADFLDPEGIEAREKAKEKYKTPPFLPEREEGNDLEELARQGKIFSTIPPRDREEILEMQKDEKRYPFDEKMNIPPKNNPALLEREKFLETDKNKSEEKERIIDNIEKQYEEYIKLGRKKKLNTAADFLEHYLDKTGTPKRFSREEAREFQFIKNSEKRNKERFESESFKGNESKMAKELLDIPDGETKNVKDSWDGISSNSTLSLSKNILATDGLDKSLSFGETVLTSEGDFEVTRKGNILEISGEVTHSWADEYDFHPMQIAAEGAIALKEANKAEPFDFGADWKQKVTGTVEISNGRLENPQLTWEDIEKQ